LLEEKIMEEFAFICMDYVRSRGEILKRRSRHMEGMLYIYPDVDYGNFFSMCDEEFFDLYVRTSKRLLPRGWDTMVVEGATSYGEKDAKDLYLIIVPPSCEKDVIEDFVDAYSCYRAWSVALSDALNGADLMEAIALAGKTGEIQTPKLLCCVVFDNAVKRKVFLSRKLTGCVFYADDFKKDEYKELLDELSIPEADELTSDITCIDFRSVIFMKYFNFFSADIRVTTKLGRARYIVYEYVLRSSLKRVSVLSKLGEDVVRRFLDVLVVSRPSVMSNFIREVMTSLRMLDVYKTSPWLVDAKALMNEVKDLAKSIKRGLPGEFVEYLLSLLQAEYSLSLFSFDLRSIPIVSMMAHAFPMKVYWMADEVHVKVFPGVKREDIIRKIMLWEYPLEYYDYLLDIHYEESRGVIDYLELLMKEHMVRDKYKFMVGKIKALILSEFFAFLGKARTEQL